MEKLESVQYSAALAVSGTMRGTSREKLYTELGWESLSSRRWCRRLTLFYKFVNNLSPGYTVDPIPPLHQSQYCLRDQDVIGEGYFGVYGIAVSGVNFVRYCGIEGKNWRYRGIEFPQCGMRYCTKISIQTSCNAIFLMKNKAYLR